MKNPSMYGCLFMFALFVIVHAAVMVAFSVGDVLLTQALTCEIGLLYYLLIHQISD